MLAENIRIDSRTRWRDAIVFLRDDIRYKNIEDMSEREELFQDFIKELEKKEREDRMKRKELAMESLTNMLKVMQQEQRVSLKTTWLDIKSTLLDLIHERHDLKGLDEIDAKRCLTEYLKVLQEEQRIESNRKKEAFQQEVSVALEQFKEVLEGLRQKHELTAFTRWKDILSRVDVTTSSAFVTLYDLMVKQQTTSQQMQQVGAGSNVQQASGGFGTDIGVAPAAGGAGGSQPFATNNVNMNVEKAEEEFYHKLRQVFDEVITKAQEIYKADKKLLKKCLHEMNYLVQHDSKYEDFKSFVCKFGKVREMEVNGVLQMVAIVEKEVAEEGEEVEEEQDSKQATGATEAAASSSSAAIVEQHVTSAQIQEVLLTRANIHLYEIFIDFHEKAKEYYEEEQRYRLKAEGRFIDMLQDHFYLSDHVHITWEEAKPILSRRSAYEAVEHKSDRKRLFHQYMMSLKEKMEAKSMSMKAYSRELEPGEYEDVPLPPNAAQQASSSSYYDNKVSSFHGNFVISIF